MFFFRIYYTNLASFLIASCWFKDVSATDCPYLYNDSCLMCPKTPNSPASMSAFLLVQSCRSDFLLITFIYWPHKASTFAWVKSKSSVCFKDRMCWTAAHSQTRMISGIPCCSTHLLPFKSSSPLSKPWKMHIHCTDNEEWQAIKVTVKMW